MPSTKGDAKQGSASRENAIDRPFEYLLTSSPASIESFHLSRMNAVANLRKELHEIFEEWVEAEVQARLARWLLARKNPEEAAAGSSLPIDSEDRPSFRSAGAPALLALHLRLRRLIPTPGLRSRDSSCTIPPTRTRRILPLDAPLATPFLATRFLATLLLAPPSPDPQIASPRSSLPNREVVHPSHAPQLPVARRTFQLLCTRARPAHPQPFQNLAKQPRCFCPFAAHIAIAQPADTRKSRRPHRDRAAS